MTRIKGTPSVFEGVEKTGDEVGFTVGHWYKLHDENTSPSGQLVDESTGEKIDNSSSEVVEHAMVGLHEINPSDTAVDRDPELKRLLKDPEIVRLFDQWEKDCKPELIKADELMLAELEDNITYKTTPTKKLAKQTLRLLRK